MHTTEQLNTALAGRYAIERLVGEGGMATVYVARDVRHNRKVALKVLKPDLGAIVGVDRFLAEIQVTANLQHPNLLPLFDSGAADTLLFYVMPYVEGESLRARLDREKQLPIDEAIRIVTAIASALDYAHRQGVIHRDLKPENVLLHDGNPLVADFGIALAVSNAGGARITQTGLSLGTPMYMSPEQATGDRTIDARTDIYSLGALAYEMIVGEPPHTGSTSQAIIARVLTEKPRSIRASRPSVPAHVEATITKALEKLPADRWATAREFSEALAGARPVTGATPEVSALSPGPAPRASGRSRLREGIAWMLAAAGIAAAASSASRPEPTPVAARLLVPLPDSVRFANTSSRRISLSRDGRWMAVVGQKDLLPQILVRRLDDTTFVPVRGSERAGNVTLSHDGEWLAFSSGGKVYKLPALGGTPQVVEARGFLPSWGDAGDLAFFYRDTVIVVPGDGSPTRRRPVPGMLGQLEVLPGSRDLVMARGNDETDAQLVLLSSEKGTVTDLKMPGANPMYVAGMMLFTRGDGSLFAAPFSVRSRTFTGPATLVSQDVSSSPLGANVAAADNGMLAFMGRGTQETRVLVEVDRNGVERILSRENRMYGEPRVSPDGQRVVMRVGVSSDRGQVWIHDMASAALTPLTTDSSNLRPEWSRDGKRVLTTDWSVRDSIYGRSRPWDGNGTVETLFRGVKAWESPTRVTTMSIGPAHGWSVFRVRNSILGDIMIAPTDSLQTQRPFVATTAAELMPRLSPSGALMAYSSDKSGRTEVYLRPVPGPGAEVTVSVSGGQEPIWSADGKSLFYRGPNRMMVATIAERPAIAVVRRDSLFTDVWDRTIPHGGYDVFPDGKHFVMTRSADSQRGKSSAVVVVVNWKGLIAPKSGKSTR